MAGMWLATRESGLHLPPKGGFESGKGAVRKVLVIIEHEEHVSEIRRQLCGHETLSHGMHVFEVLKDREGRQAGPVNSGAASIEEISHTQPLNQSHSLTLRNVRSTEPASVCS